MKFINSNNSKEFKNLLNICKSAGKNEIIAIEGSRLCESWLHIKGIPIIVVINSEYIDNLQINSILKKIPNNIKFFLKQNLIDQLLSSKGKYNKDILFIVRKPLLLINKEPITDNCVLLENVQDPGNVGTILRTCAAAGIRKVYLSDKCSRPWSQKVLRSAQCAHFNLLIYENVNLKEILNLIKIPIIATTNISDNSIDLYKTNLPHDCVWVFGNEGKGVSKEIIKIADIYICINHESYIESLNIAAAAAICLFEQKRQLKY